MRVWIELPLAYPEVVDAYVRRIPGVVRASTVNDADAAIFIIDSPLTPALRAVSDYVLTQPRFKDHVLAIAVGPIDAVPWIFRKLEFYDARDVGAAEVGAHVMRWLWAVATASSALARAVDATVPYVQATLAPHSSVTTVVGQPDPVMVDAARRAGEVLAELARVETALQQITATTRSDNRQLAGICRRLGELRDTLRLVAAIDDVARRRAWADTDTTAARVALAKPKPACGCHCAGGCGDPDAACVASCREHTPL